MSPEHRKHAVAYDRVVTIAKETVASVACHCHECWTRRGEHDPGGCAWEDLEDLRSAVRLMNEAAAALPKRGAGT